MTIQQQYDALAERWADYIKSPNTRGKHYAGPKYRAFRIDTSPTDHHYVAQTIRLRPGYNRLYWSWEYLTKTDDTPTRYDTYSEALYAAYLFHNYPKEYRR